MKKMFLMVAFLTIAMCSFANEVKYDLNKKTEKLDSVSNVLVRNNNTIKINLPSFKGDFIYNSFIKTNYENCVKYETVLTNNLNEDFAMNVLFYANGNKAITIKKLKSGGMVNYILN